MDPVVTKSEGKGVVGREREGEERERTRPVEGKEKPGEGGEGRGRGEVARDGTEPKPRQRRQVEDAKGQGEGGRGEKQGRQEGLDPEGGQEDQHKLTLIVSTQKKHGSILAITLISIITVITMMAFVYLQEAGSGTGKESLRKFNHSAFHEVEASFPNQTTSFWKILRNRAIAHLKNPNPKKPLVFMFTAPPSAYKVIECIASKFARSLSYKDKGTGLVNSGDYHRNNLPDDAKKALDEKLKEILENGQTLLVFDVDRLPVQSPLLFYEYCDNENAPYTHAAIIFTVRLPSEPDPSLTPAKAEGLVVEYLRETWGKQGYKKDDVPPLVARITDTVVMVMGESDETIERNCAT